MNILFTSMFCCIRVVKEGLALLKSGHSVHFIQNTVQNGPEILRQLANLSFYGDLEQYRRKVEAYQGVDIIHVHNEPDDIVYTAKEAQPDTPLVYDCHDLASINLRGDLEAERRAMEAADAYIFPSQGYMDRAIENWGLPENKPKAVLYPMCLNEHIVRTQLPRIPGVCYQGGLIGSKNNQDPATQKFFEMGATYRDHTDLAEFLTFHDIPFGIYGVYPEIASEYLELGALCMGVIAYHKMIPQLSRYDWGFVGSVEPHDAMRYCMPNKLFEYAAAGVPMVVMNCEEAGRFVEENELGIYVKSMDEFYRRYEEHEEFRKKVLARRKLFLMEDHIDRVENVSAQLVKV